MAVIPIPRDHMVRVHGVANAGYPQVYSTFLIYDGQKAPLDTQLSPQAGHRNYMELPVDWTLEVQGGHIVYGRYVGSNEAPYSPLGNPVVVGYDDSGGKGVDFSNLVVYIEKIRMWPGMLRNGLVVQQTVAVFSLILRASWASVRKVYNVRLTDGSGDSGYAVILQKEAAIWEDNSSAGHEISAISQSGNVLSSGAGLACSDGVGTALMLDGASWDMARDASGNAHRQVDPGSPVEHDWHWEVV